MGDRRFGVVLVKGLLPVFAVVAQLGGGFGGGETGAAAVNRFHAVGVESFSGLAYGAQVRVQHADESAAKKKIEAAKATSAAGS